MDRQPNVYIVEYYIKRGAYDDSIGAKRSMLIVGYSKDDVKNTFTKSNPKSNLIGIDVDLRQVALSADVLLSLLQNQCPAYMKSIKLQNDIDEKRLAEGKQYNSVIVNERDNSLLRGL